MKPFAVKSLMSAALACGLFASPVALGAAALMSSTAAARAESAPTIESMKATLAGYGEFVTHAKYGEVWKPTVTPRGWHPYPACDWAYVKDYGWYFDDKTPWGAIVHHYGRWTHDEAQGWLWAPGVEFSPGWVVWKTSAEWIGWAPQMPDVDMTEASLVKFDDDKLWTFMDAKKFGKTCDGVGGAASYPVFYGSTTFVTEMTFVNGVGVFVLPPVIIAPIVDIDIGVFAPWSPTFIGSWVWNWTSIFNDIDANIVIVSIGGGSCTPKNDGGDKNHPVNQKPFAGSSPPPAPGGSKRLTSIGDQGPVYPNRPPHFINERRRPAGIDQTRTVDPMPDGEIRGFRPDKRAIRHGREPGRDAGRRIEPSDPVFSFREPRHVGTSFARPPRRDHEAQRPQSFRQRGDDGLAARMGRQGPIQFRPSRDDAREARDGRQMIR